MTYSEPPSGLALDHNLAITLRRTECFFFEPTLHHGKPRRCGMASAGNDPTAGDTTKVQPKEYKLQVLVGTVAYLKYLGDRVETLERVTPERVRGGTGAPE